MNMTTPLKIIKILQTKLAHCINNIIELVVIYFKRILNTALNLLQLGYNVVL